MDYRSLLKELIEERETLDYAISVVQKLIGEKSVKRRRPRGSRSKSQIDSTDLIGPSSNGNVHAALAGTAPDHT